MVNVGRPKRRSDEHRGEARCWERTSFFSSSEGVEKVGGGLVKGVLRKDLANQKISAEKKDQKGSDLVVSADPLDKKKGGILKDRR